MNKLIKINLNILSEYFGEEWFYNNFYKNFKKNPKKEDMKTTLTFLSSFIDLFIYKENRKNDNLLYIIFGILDVHIKKLQEIDINNIFIMDTRLLEANYLDYLKIINKQIIELNILSCAESKKIENIEDLNFIKKKNFEINYVKKGLTLICSIDDSDYLNLLKFEINTKKEYMNYNFPYHSTFDNIYWEMQKYIMKNKLIIKKNEKKIIYIYYFYNKIKKNDK